MSKSKDEKEEEVVDSDSGSKSPQEVSIKEFVNASGHVQEVDRNFNLLSLTAVGIVNGMVWPALGGSILVAIFNGGPPGVLYEL
jgi:choline transport protein